MARPIEGTSVVITGVSSGIGVALHRKTIGVNSIGVVQGAAAALPIFKRAGEGGLHSTVSMGG